MELGISVIKKQLEELGYSTRILDGKFIAFDYVIPLGRFRGEKVEIALQAPQFPLNPPSGPFIKPFLLPITGGGGTHPFGGIHAQNHPTSEWQYWSRPFHNWNNSQKNISDYLAFIRTLFDFE